jgi:hypothetical protein
VRAKSKPDFDDALTHRLLHNNRSMQPSKSRAFHFFFVKPTMKTEFPLVEIEK